MPITLDVGCGTKKLVPTAIGIDRIKSDCVDVVGDAKHLPFRDECFSRVYSSHVLEHFSWLEHDDIIGEWVRVLKSEGLLDVHVPNMAVRCFLFILVPQYQTGIYGSQENTFMFHKSGFTVKTLKTLLKKHSLENIKSHRDVQRWKKLLPADIHMTGKKK